MMRSERVDPFASDVILSSLRVMVHPPCKDSTAPEKTDTWWKEGILARQDVPSGKWAVKSLGQVSVNVQGHYTPPCDGVSTVASIDE